MTHIPEEARSQFKACSITGCDGNAHWSARGNFGWCQGHLRRWKKYGDPRGGRPTMNGEPERFFRDVVMSYEGDECLFWPFSKFTSGYGALYRNGRPNSVSRLVCEAVKGPPPAKEYEAAHSCGNGHLACVTKRHLSWKTSAGNKADELIHGTRVRGEKHTSAKLTEPEVRQILALKGIKTQSKIAEQFGISVVHVSCLHRRVYWGWLEAP